VSGLLDGKITVSCSSCRPRDPGKPVSQAVTPGSGRSPGPWRTGGAGEPAPDRLAQLALQLSPDVAEGRRTRPAVEVLVGAADGEVGTGPGEVDRHRADRVGRVPEGQRTVVVGQPGEVGHVGHGARAVGDVGQAERRRAVEVGGEAARSGPWIGSLGTSPVVNAVVGGEALQDVAVGGEVVVVGDQRSGAPASPACRPWPGWPGWLPTPPCRG
jgi:hypothetical protein